MKRDEILAMARAAGLQRTNPGEAVEVVRFAEMVAAREREACAEVCDRGAEQMLHAYKREGAARCASVIRARGQKEGA